MKTITTYLMEKANFLVKKHVATDKKVTAKKWKYIDAYNQADVPYSLGNFGFMLSMNMVEKTYKDLCGINNVGSNDKTKAVEYVLNNCLSDGYMPTAQEVADALNNSGLGYNSWEAYKEDENSITITAKEGWNKFYIHCGLK